jgi:predicted CXXCH cytochrome family protein
MLEWAFMKQGLFLGIIFLLCFLPSPVSAEETGCRKCHEKLVKEKVVHPAIEMGCEVCHSGIVAATVPHKKTNARAYGLSSDQPQLCYGCHDASLFTKKDVHPAVTMGCTNCHNPHSSPYAKLLVSEPPGLCYSCHDKAGFTGKMINHEPVYAGKCLTCHTPHSSDETALLLMQPLEVCLQCHKAITHGQQHKVTSSGKAIEDPTRPGRSFYCGTCHEPHGSNGMLMFRYNAQSVTELCLYCHKLR